MLGQALMLAVAMTIPHSHYYGGRSLNTIRAAVARRGVDFGDRELNRAFDRNDKTIETVVLDVAFDRVVVSTVRVGDWPPKVTPLVTVWRRHENYLKLTTLVRVEPRKGRFPIDPLGIP